MLPLGCGEEDLAINGGEQVIVSNVPVVRAGYKVRHAEGRSQCMGRARVGDGAYGLDGEGPRP